LTVEGATGTVLRLGAVGTSPGFTITASAALAAADKIHYLIIN
jgi:hypothetical protein